MKHKVVRKVRTMTEAKLTTKTVLLYYERIIVYQFVHLNILFNANYLCIFKKFLMR